MPHSIRNGGIGEKRSWKKAYVSIGQCLIQLEMNPDIEVKTIYKIVSIGQFLIQLEIDIRAVYEELLLFQSVNASFN